MSCKTPFWKRQLHRFTPFLFKRCPEGNYHWRLDRLCFCRLNEFCGDEWHGGILDFKTGAEYHFHVKEKPAVQRRNKW